MTMRGDKEPSPHVPQLRALLFTDLVDSTSLVERIGDSAAAELFQQHDRLVLAMQQRWHGQQIDRSDGLFLLFERPVDALGFALDYQQGLRQLGQANNVPLFARAGLHVGEVILWDNSAEAIALGSKPVEVEGLAKPMAARLMQLARPGQVLLSATAESMVRRATDRLGDVGKGLKWKAYGRWRFKGVAQPMEVHGVATPALPPVGRPRATPKAMRDIPFWRRPMAMAAEATFAMMLVVGGWFATRPTPALAFVERDWVVLADVSNLTGESIFDASMRQAMLLGLEQSPYVNVLSEGKVRESLELARQPTDAVLDRRRAVDVASREGARAVLLPKVMPHAGRYDVSVDLVDPTDNKVVTTYHAQASSPDQAVAAVGDVVEQLRRGLGEPLAALEKSVPLPQATTSNLRALRAYALGEMAMGRRRFDEARNLYQAALDLDPEFALAYMGIAKYHARTSNTLEAREQLQKALALQGRLPFREQLYMKGWQAELQPGGWPLEQWRLLAKLYPDSFAGLSNTSWHLLMDNRFREAEPFASAAAVPQDHLRTYPMLNIARIQIAENQPERALHTLKQIAELRGSRGPDDTQVDALVALRRYDEALALLRSMGNGNDALQSLMFMRARMLVAADQGDCDAMRVALESDSAKPELIDYRIQQHLMHATVATLCSAADEAPLRALAAQLQPLLAERDNPNLTDRTLQLLALAYLGQRQGYGRLSDEILQKNKALIDLQKSPVVAKWRTIVRAMGMLGTGEPDAAISLLTPLLDGSEPVQAHVVLLQAHRARRDERGIVQQQQWLAQHRGQAIAEVAALQVWQALNAHDVATWAAPAHPAGRR